MRNLSVIKIENRVDKMTSLFDNTAFNEELGCSDIKTVILIDIKKFGSINFTEGNVVGDSVLIQLAKSITKHFSDEEIYKCYRIGGDEFSVLTCRTVPSETIVEKVYKIIGECKSCDIIPFDISVGYSKSGNTGNEMYLKAQELLLVSKEVVCSSLTSE